MNADPIITAFDAITSGRDDQPYHTLVRLFNDEVVVAALAGDNANRTAMALLLSRTLAYAGVSVPVAPVLVQLGEQISASEPPGTKMHDIGRLLCAQGQEVQGHVNETLRSLLGVTDPEISPAASTTISRYLDEAWRLIDMDGGDERGKVVAAALILGGAPDSPAACHGHLLMAAISARQGNQRRFDYHFRQVREPVVMGSKMYSSLKQKTSVSFGAAATVTEPITRVALEVMQRLLRDLGMR